MESFGITDCARERLFGGMELYRSGKMDKDYKYENFILKLDDFKNCVNERTSVEKMGQSDTVNLDNDNGEISTGSVNNVHTKVKKQVSFKPFQTDKNAANESVLNNGDSQVKKKMSFLPFQTDKNTANESVAETCKRIGLGSHQSKRENALYNETSYSTHQKNSNQTRTSTKDLQQSHLNQIVSFQQKQGWKQKQHEGENKKDSKNEEAIVQSGEDMNLSPPNKSSVKVARRLDFNKDNISEKDDIESFSDSSGDSKSSSNDV